MPYHAERQCVLALHLCSQLAGAANPDPALPEGALLKPDQGGLPMIYSQHWPAAGADSFGLQTAWLQPTILLTKLYNFIFKKRICTECQFRVI
jgi:hypothetical protein